MTTQLDNLVDAVRNHGGVFILDQDQYTSDELAARVIKFAVDYGWGDVEAAGYSDRYFDGEDTTGFASDHNPHWTLSEALADCAFDASYSATEYLNDNTPDDVYFGSDNGIYGARLVSEEDNE